MADVLDVLGGDIFLKLGWYIWANFKGHEQIDVTYITAVVPKLAGPPFDNEKENALNCVKILQYDDFPKSFQWVEKTRQIKMRIWEWWPVGCN